MMRRRAGSVFPLGRTGRMFVRGGMVRDPAKSKKRSGCLVPATDRRGYIYSAGKQGGRTIDVKNKKIIH